MNNLLTIFGNVVTHLAKRCKKQETRNNRLYLASCFLFLNVSIVAIALVVTFVTVRFFANAQEGQRNEPVLAACSGSTIVFPRNRFIFLTNPVERLRRDYHATVEQVVSAHAEEPRVVCTENVREVPTAALNDLAEKLPPWRTPIKLAGLRESDIGAVLLEYLRVYECTLKEHEYFGSTRVAEDTQDSLGIFNIFTFMRTSAERNDLIRKELVFARRALERTLQLMGGIDRLRPVDASLECLQRSSVDVRNLVGLAADASSCLPRALDAKTSLRDISSDPPKKE